MSESPYKFLDYYESGDAEIFFGREREIRILMSDVIVSRLVVLFAKTGTGKTSLINAGVRPRLEERGYGAFFIRVRKDPVESARIELQKRLATTLSGQSLLELMREINERFPKQSRVLFFDQFEEFFIFVKSASEKGRQFISDAAHLSEDKECGVHLVFSMREEWFHEMNDFRDKIPTIFHNDSNLRLRWLDGEQARVAIEEPARAFGVTFDPKLVDELIHDLSDPGENGTIEPAQLQIVCDTLWRHREGGRLNFDHYRRLGESRDKTLSIAQQVLLQRLTEEFEKIEDKEGLDLLARVLPELGTPRKTKNLWEIGALALHIKAPIDGLRKLVCHLEQSRLLRTTERDSLLLVELAHDYLVDRLDDIAVSVQFVWPRRVLDKVWQQYRTDRKVSGASELDIISAHAHGLTLTPDQSEFLFRSALENGNHMRLWFEHANAANVDVWALLENLLLRGNPTVAYSAVHLLSELNDEQALKLLERALERDELASSVIEALGDMQTLSAIGLLEKASQGEQWLPQVRVALDRLNRSRNSEVAQLAGAMLSRLTELERPRGLRGLFRRAAESREALDRRFAIDSKISVPAAQLQSLLENGRVIPFLGPGANMTPEEDDNWLSSKSPSPPTQQTLARYLADRCAFPAEHELERGDLARVASYFSTVGSRADLQKELHAIYARDFLITPLHRYLAELSAPLLVVTTNFDTTLERAFEMAGRPCDVVFHPNDRLEYGGSVLWWRFGTAKPQVVPANELPIDVKSTTVIYKIYGSAVASDPSLESYVITEDDHIELLSRLTGIHGVPMRFLAQFKRSHFLFLGLSLREWALRQILFQIKADVKSTSWAIQRYPSEVEKQLWNARNVHLYDLDLTEFVSRLRERD